MKTKFYRIKPDKNIINTYSVSSTNNRKAIRAVEWNKWRSIHITDNFYTLTPTELVLPRLIHTKSTPLTDIIIIESFPNRGFVISTKFFKLLEGYNLPLVKTYPIEISYKNEIYIYYYIHFIHDSSMDVDYDKTRFYVHKNGKTEPKGLVSYDDWAYAFNNQISYYIRNMSIDDEIYFTDFNYDIFTLERIFYDSIIVTERLKIVLESELYGVTFEECKKFIKSF